MTFRKDVFLKKHLSALTMLACLVLFSCKKNELAPPDYATWLKDPGNGLIIEKSNGQGKFTLQYKPIEYIAALELGLAKPSKSELEQKVSEYEGAQYFDFKIYINQTAEKARKEHLQPHRQEQQWRHNFDMQYSFKLVEGTDTLDCILFHYEPTAGITPYESYSLAFPESKNNADKTIIFNDKIHKTGKNIFTIKANDIAQIPKLKTY